MIISYISLKITLGLFDLMRQLACQTPKLDYRIIKSQWWVI
jgi:hypothetical protein